MPRIREICTIDGKIWAIREFEQPDDPHTLLWSVMYYDWKTGEVWGRRTLVPVDPNDKIDIYWTTEQRQKETMDMTEWVEVHQRTVPLGLVAAAVVGRGKPFSSPIIPQ